MEIDLQAARMFLTRHQTLGVREAKGYRVVCRQGGLWITEEGDRRDIVIGAGESFLIDNNGLTLLHATEDACIGLSRPGRDSAWAAWRRMGARWRSRAQAARAGAEFSPAR